jgi:hypothetical protein
MDDKHLIALDAHMQVLKLCISWLETGKAKKYNEEIKTLNDMIDAVNRIERWCKKRKIEVENER